MSDIENQKKQLQAMLDTQTERVKVIGEKAHAEASKLGEMTAETRQKVDASLETQGELRARIQVIEQALANKGVSAPANAAPRFRNVGEYVTGSDVFKNAQQAGFVSNFRVDHPAPRSLRNDLLESDPASGQALIAPNRLAGIVGPPAVPVEVSDLFRWGVTDSPIIEYVVESGWVNAAATVPEKPAGGKPVSKLSYKVERASVKTIAHLLPASVQILQDVGQLQSTIANRLLDGLKEVENYQLLNGDGTGENILGLLNVASKQTDLKGVSVSSKNQMDVIRLAILQAELSRYNVDNIVLNKIDWANIELLKDNEDRYLVANPFGTITNRLWGRNVVATQYIDQNNFVVGAFAQGAQAWTRSDAAIAIATQDIDNFRTNMVTLRAEERIGLTVYRPEAFVKGTLNTGTGG